MEQNDKPVAPQIPASRAATPASGNLNMYPELIIPQNTHPNKLYAFPVIGFAIKFIMLIPVFIVAAFVGFIAGVLWFITPFTILFRGKYWNAGYEWIINSLTYSAKIHLFLAGITDKYPGFTLDANGIFEMRLPKPESPSRFLGFPIIGVLIRVLLMIPYYFYIIILAYSMEVAVVASWFGVWIKGSYPESLYEFIKDQLRVSFAYDAYLYYLSDTYPSFKISMNHKKVKIILLILGILITLLDFTYQINADMHRPHPSYYDRPASGSDG